MSYLALNLEESPRYGYFAGIIDGEGCFHARMDKRGRLVVRLEVCTTSDALLEWLTEHFGGRSYLRPNLPENRKPCWTWYLPLTDARPVMERLLPFLVIKRRQAEIFMRLAELREGHKAHIPEGERFEREALLIEMREAKRAA